VEVHIKTIALPRGYRPGPAGTGGSLLFSVFLAPKLIPTERSGTLAAYLAMLSWPDARFTVEAIRFSGDRANPAWNLPAFVNTPAILKPPPNGGAFWKALFPGSTPVRPWSLKASPTESYAVDPLHADVRTVYRDYIAAAMPPTGSKLTTAAAKLRGLADFKRFHPPAGNAASCPPPKPPDFHEIIASLGTYPHVLRASNLVIDLEVALLPKELTALQSKGNGRLSIVLRATTTTYQPTRWIVPWTLYTFAKIKGDWHFLPRHGANAQDHVDGQLRFGDTSRFGHTIIDLVGAVHQLSNTGPGAAPAALPRLRSAGICIYRQDRKKSVDESMKISRTNEANLASPHQIELCWEQLARGYAIDVQVDGTWRSLCERVGTYRVGKTTYFKDLTDEGCISLAVTERDSALLVHESILTWEGFSLCAPRPTVAPGTATTCSAPAGLETEFSPRPGSLTPLRYGKTYQLRARLVDLAGNRLRPGPGELSIEALFDPKQAATKDITYLRFEPPRAPTVHADEATAPAPGLPDANDVETLVLRSPSRGQQSKPTTYWLAPPAVPWTLWEEHGVLDRLLPAERAEAVKKILDAARQPWRDTLNRRRLPFFHDPIVDQILVRGLPQPRPPHDGRVYLKLVGASHNDREPVRIQLEPAAAGGFRFDPRSNTLIIQLPPGYDETVILSPCISRTAIDSLLGMFAVPGWIPPADIPQLKKAVEDGLNETLCPPRRLRLVHAVGRPEQPRLKGLLPSRGRGDTIATIQGVCEIDDPEVIGHVDLEARWKEAVDDLRRDRPTEALVDVKIGRASVKPERRLALSTPHSLPDPRYRGVTYRATAVSRFGEFFGAADSLAVRSGDAPELHVPAAAPPSAPEPTFVVPTFRWTGDAAWRGDRREHRRNGFSARVYLARPWWSSGAGEMLAIVLADKPDDVSNLERSYLSQWGADPRYLTEPAGGADARMALRGHMFRDRQGPVATVDDLMIFPQGVATKVRAAVYPMTPEANYSSERGQWFCDLEIDFAEPRVYSPFLRLALARFQRHAIRDTTFDYRLSPVVVADIVQLQPDRHAVVKRSGESFSVTVAGDMPSNAESVLRADVVVQARAGEQEHVGWHDLATHSMSLEPVPASSHKQWVVRDVRMPAGKDPGAPSCGARRLMIREYHRFPDAAGEASKAERIAYLDVFEW
jgi:hypothetical protein